jgi:hypothetical protein
LIRIKTRRLHQLPRRTDYTLRHRALQSLCLERLSDEREAARRL